MKEKRNLTSPKLKLFAAFAVMALLIAFAVSASAASFNDVSKTDWYYGNLTRMCDAGIVSGTSDTTFSPNDNVTKVQAVVFAARIHAGTYGNTIDQASGDSWASPYLLYAYNNGILTQKRIGPLSLPITRAQFAEILAHSVESDKLKAKNTVESGSIYDVPTGAYYADEVYTLYRAGVLTGNNDRGDFNPNSYITRAEAVAIIDRIINSSQRKSVTLSRPSDEYTVKKMTLDDLVISDSNKNQLQNHANADAINTSAIFSLGNNWYYSTKSGNRDTALEAVYKDVFNRLMYLFGREAMTYKPCIIYENENADNPVTYFFGEVNTIILHPTADDDVNYQMVYQLAHEMTHYAYGSLQPDKNLSNTRDVFAQWNEEVVCEAMSFYMLNYMYAVWDATELSTVEPLGAVYAAAWIGWNNDGVGLTMKSDSGKTYTPAEFEAMSEVADDNRDEHAAETSFMYELMCKKGDGCFCELLDMYDYYNQTYDYIDYDSWQQSASAYDIDFIEQMSRIQPNISK